MTSILDLLASIVGSRKIADTIIKELRAKGYQICLTEECALQRQLDIADMILRTENLHYEQEEQKYRVR